MHYILILALFLLLSCSESSTQKPRLINTDQERELSNTQMNTTTAKVKIATIEAQTQKELAQIERKKALELENIKKEIETKKLETTKEIALQNQYLDSQKLLQSQKESNTFTFIILFIFITSLLTLIYFLRKKREDQLKFHEDEISIKEKELQVKIAEKMLDTLASGKLAPNEEKKIVELFEKSSKEFPKIQK